MRRKLIILVLLFLFMIAGIVIVSAQVTIGTGEEPLPGTLLQLKDISKVTDDAANASKGLGLPRVVLTDQDNLFPMFETDGAGGYKIQATTYSKAEEDKKHKGLLVYNVGTGAGFTEALYYWTGASWKELGMVEPWNISGTNQAATLNTQSIYQMGQVTIGSPAVTTSSALLNVEATDKGILLPRVTLTHNKDVTTISNPAIGLLVYNTGAYEDPVTHDYPFAVTGFLYWNGKEWKLMNNSTSIPPSIGILDCGGVMLSPGIYYSGVAYTGIVRIPYSDGNGGYYTGGSTFTSNGLTFVLQDGKLENGNGELVLGVTGTPNISSPAPVIIPVNGADANSIQIPFWNGNCNLTVGNLMDADIKTISVMGNFTYVNDVVGSTGREGYEFKIVTPDGRFSIRAFLPSSGYSFSQVNLQLKSNMGDVKVASVEGSWYAGGTVSNSRNLMPVKGGTWGGNSNNGRDNNNTWFEQQSGNFPAWGDYAVYYSSSPESRIYCFTVADGSDKVFYKFDFMMMTIDGSTSYQPNATTCPNGFCTGTKAFFAIQQIRAL
jgi:hypothetical protein